MNSLGLHAWADYHSGKDNVAEAFNPFHRGDNMVLSVFRVNLYICLGTSRNPSLPWISHKGQPQRPLCQGPISVWNLGVVGGCVEKRDIGVVWMLSCGLSRDRIIPLVPLMITMTQQGWVRCFGTRGEANTLKASMSVPQSAFTASELFISHYNFHIVNHGKVLFLLSKRDISLHCVCSEFHYFQTGNEALL